MAESSEVKPKCEKPVYCIVFIVILIGTMLFMGIYVHLCLRQLQSYHIPIHAKQTISRDELEYTFTAYMRKFGKIYSKNEFQQRFENFKQSVLDIQMLNEAHNGSAKFGFTKFSDAPRVPGLDYSGDDYTVTCSRSAIFKQESNLPLKFDWRERGFVGKVLSQGKCQSCWAHCVVGVMESMVMIRNVPQSHQYSNLSIQELIDCSTYTNGCQRGNPVNGLEFLCDKKYPIVTAREYPLTNRKADCRTGKAKRGVHVSQFWVENNVKPERLQQIIVQHGPVTTIVNSMTWLNYLGGVLMYHCSPAPLNHVVQIVGYNKEGPVPYFIMKNSWGRDWGEEGYVKIAMGGVCGVGTQITYLDVDII